MPLTREDAERCLVVLEKAVDIAMTDSTLLQNIRALYCVTIILQEYVSFLLPALKSYATHDSIGDFIPDMRTRVEVRINLPQKQKAGIILQEVNGGEYRIVIKQVVHNSPADYIDSIEVDMLVLEINRQTMTRVNIDKANRLLSTAEQNGIVTLVLARSHGVEEEGTKFRMARAVRKLSSRLLQASTQELSEDSTKSLGEAVRIVRSISHSSIGSLESRNTTINGVACKRIHIRKGKTELGVRFRGGRNEETGVDELYIVDAITPGLPAALDGRLSVGDAILMINGSYITGLSIARVMSIVNNPRQIIQIVYQDCNNNNNSDYQYTSDYHSDATVIEKVIATNNTSRALSTPNSLQTNNNNTKHTNNMDTSSQSDNIISHSMVPDIRGLKDESQWQQVYKKSIADSVSLGSRNSQMKASFQIRRILLERTSTTPLGFTIVGGKGSSKGDIGIFVRHIHERGAAYNEGTLQIGDEILEVNGVKMEGISQRKAVQIFKKIKYGKILLKLKARVLDKPQGSEIINSEKISVTLQKASGAGLGLELVVLIENCGGYEDGIYIQSVREGSVAEKEGSLHRGDQLLRIQDVHLIRSNLQQAHAIIGTLLPGPVVLYIRRYAEMQSLLRILTLDKGPAKMQSNTASKFSTRLEPRSPSYYLETSSPLQPVEMALLDYDDNDNKNDDNNNDNNNDDGDDDDDEDIFKDDDDTKLLTLESLLQSYESDRFLRMSREELKNADIDALLSPINTPTIPEELQHTQSDSENTKSDTHSDSGNLLLLSEGVTYEQTTTKNDLERINTAKFGYNTRPIIENVTIYRVLGETLGMNVLSESTPQGGVLVTAISKRGPAYKQGRIRVGDELIKVNNTSLIGLTQSQVLALLSSLTGELSVSVIKTPEENKVVTTPSAKLTRKLDQYSRSFTGFDMLEMNFTKSPTESLGISLKPSKGITEGYTEIRRLLMGGYAEKEGRLQKGDRLYAMDSQPLYRKSQSEVMKLLRNASDEFTLIILRQAAKLVGSDTSLSASTLSVVSQETGAGRHNNSSSIPETNYFNKISFEASLKGVSHDNLSTPLKDTTHRTYQLINTSNQLINTSNLKSSIDKVSVVSEQGSDFTNVTPASSIDFINKEKSFSVNTIDGDKQYEPDVTITSSPDKIEDLYEKPFPPTSKRIPFRKRRNNKYTPSTGNTAIHYYPLPPSTPPPPAPTHANNNNNNNNINNNNNNNNNDDDDATVLVTQNILLTDNSANLEGSILSEVTDHLPKPLIFNREKDKLLVDNICSTSQPAHLELYNNDTSTDILKQSFPVGVEKQSDIKVIKFTKTHNLIGIKLRDINPGEVKVVMIAARSSLKHTTLQEGDLIISINGNPVTSKKQTEKFLSSLPKGTHTIEAMADIQSDDNSKIDPVSELINQNLDLQNQNTCQEQSSHSVFYNQNQSINFYNQSSLEEDKIQCLKSDIIMSLRNETELAGTTETVDTKSKPTEEENKITHEIILNNISSVDQIGTGIETIPEEGIIEVTLKRTEIETNYGLELYGGADTPLHYIYVKSVDPYSPADRCGVIQPGDQLIMMGNECFIGLNNKNAINLYEKLSKQQQQWNTFILQRKKPQSNFTPKTSFTPTLDKSKTFTKMTNLLSSRILSNSLKDFRSDKLNYKNEHKSSIYTESNIPVKHTTQITSVPESNAIILNKKEYTAAINNDVISNNNLVERFEVQLKTEEGTKLGMVLGGGVDQGEEKVYIRKIASGSVVGQDGRLKIGDEIESINHVELTGMSHKIALQMMRDAIGGHLVLSIARPMNNRITSPTYSSASSLSGFPPQIDMTSSFSSTGTPFNTKPSPLLYRYSPMPERPAPYSTRLLSTNIDKTLTNNNNTNTTNNTTNNNNNNNNVTLLDRAVRSTTSIQHENSITVNSLMIKNKLESNKALSYIELVKGPKGLGLSLKGSTDGSAPIQVKSLQSDGNAALSGKISVEDEIIDINNVSCVGKPITEVLSYIKELPIGPLMLLIKKAE